MTSSMIKTSSVAPEPQQGSAMPKQTTSLDTPKKGGDTPKRGVSNSLHSLPTAASNSKSTVVNERTMLWMKAQSFHNKAGQVSMDIQDEKDPEVKAAITVQRYVRKRYYDSLRLHRKHLSQSKFDSCKRLTLSPSVMLTLHPHSGLRYEREIVRGGTCCASIALCYVQLM